MTNPGTTPITILAVNSDHGLSFAGEETRTIVWVSFSLQIYNTFEFWRFKFSVVWVLAWPCPSFPWSFRKYQGKPPKHQGFFSPCEPLKTLKKSRQHSKRPRNFASKKNTKETKKNTKEKTVLVATPPTCYRSLSGFSGPKCPGSVPRGVSGVLRAPGSRVSQKCPESVPGASKRCPEHSGDTLRTLSGHFRGTLRAARGGCKVLAQRHLSFYPLGMGMVPCTVRQRSLMSVCSEVSQTRLGCKSPGHPGRLRPHRLDRMSAGQTGHFLGTNWTHPTGWLQSQVLQLSLPACKRGFFGVSSFSPSTPRLRRVQKVSRECPRERQKGVSRTIRRHSRDTFWTLWSSWGPKGPGDTARDTPGTLRARRAREALVAGRGGFAILRYTLSNLITEIIRR